MKVKISGKKAVSLILSVLMVFSFMSVGFTAGAENDCGHPKLTEDGWTVVNKPTCSSSGKKTQYCPDCYTDVEFIMDLDPDAHIKGPWETVTVHTCNQVGRDVRKCTECGIVLESRVVPMHDYSVLYGDKATCMKPGYEFVMCTTCYDMKTKEFPIDTAAHNFGEWIVEKEATCVNESGTRVRFCMHFDENGNQCTAVETENYTAPENHVNITWDKQNTVVPTCYQEGYIPGKCDDCGEELRDPLEKHSYSGYTVLRTEPSTCFTHGTEYRYCECGLEYSVELELDENNHVYGDWKVTKQPGCTDGIRSKYCLYHDDAVVSQNIPANGEHNYGDWIVDLEPDCTRTGLRHKECADCSATITQELPVKHDFATWITEAKMDCTEGASQNGTKLAKCNNCNYEKYFTIPAVHSFGKWTIKTVADCKKGTLGVKTRTCSGCGKVETIEYAAEHDFTKWVVRYAPVCESEEGSGRPGTYVRWCTKCKTEETKPIPVTHEFINWEILDYGKCYSDGRTESGQKTGYCKFCGEVKTVPVEAEHVYGDWKVVTASTCTSKGIKERVCYSCGYVDSEEIPAAHVYGEWTAEGGFTCGKGTKEMTRTCKLCSEGKETKEVTLSHPNIRNSTVAPSCTTSGYTTEYCPDCGYSKVYDIVPATGHKLDEKWTIRHEATCSAPGSRYKACADCDYLEFENIARTEHILMELAPGLLPTCTEKGYSPKSYCSVCKVTFESEELPALGHEFAEGSEICTRCKVYNGSDNCTCSCHSTSGMEKLIFSIINKLYQLFGINQYCKCGIAHYDEPGFFAKLFG